MIFMKKANEGVQIVKRKKALCCVAYDQVSR